MTVTIYDLSGCAPCCGSGVVTPCNPTKVLFDLPLVFTYNGNQISLTATYSPTAGPGGVPAWVTASVQILICGNFEFGQFIMWCDGGVWKAGFAYYENGVFQSIATPTGMSGGTVLSTNPLCVTFTAPNFTFTGCGSTGDMLFAIGTCNVIPACCDWASMPETATITYSINGFSPTTANLNKGADFYAGAAVPCVVGDGTFITVTFFVRCDVTGWSFGLSLHHETFAHVVIKSGTWALSNVVPGTVRSDLQISCSPFHFHYVGGNILGQAAFSSVTCDGRSYQFGPVGTIPIVMDAVTP